MFTEEDLRQAAQELFDALKSSKLTLSTAESCTGGNIAHHITLIPGSSEIFMGGAVTYSNAAKTNLLGVPAETIERYGAVSEEVVRAMAEGASRQFQTDCAIATSGIAGPGGGSPAKPVGTVWTAIKTPAGFHTECLHLHALQPERYDISDYSAQSENSDYSDNSDKSSREEIINGATTLTLRKLAEKIK